MKKITVSILLVVSQLALANPFGQKNMPANLHLDPEMTGREYQNLLQPRILQGEDNLVSPSLSAIMKLGKRNLDWLILINSNRTNKLSFSNEANTRAYPITTPNKYNESIVVQKANDLLAKLPEPMKSILTEKQPMTETLPLTEKEYLEWGFEADRVYQGAARWISMQPYLSSLAARRSSDIRGIYFLSRDPQREQNLNNFAALNSDQQKNYLFNLFSMCLNSRSGTDSCNREVTSAQQSNALNNFYNKYLPYSQKLYNNFFDIPAGGMVSGPKWTSNEPQKMFVPFLNTSNLEIKNFLQTNIQNEWKWNGWQLVTDFEMPSSTKVDVRFEPGVVPHVPYLGSPVMYMDANAPLTEYDVRWTIRHEFGHVLGFPDCYVEFYEEENGAITNYQIDTTDLMCSRRGKLKERHFTELKRRYYK